MTTFSQAIGGRFELFSPSHVGTLILIPILWVITLLLLKKTRENLHEKFCYSMAVLLVGQYTLWIAWEIWTGQLSLALSLPLNLCDLSNFLCAVLLITQRRALFEIIYFWAIAGSLQSFVTPNIVHGFPHLEFFTFYVQHGGEILTILYFAIVKGFRPYPLSMVKSFGLLCLFVAFVYGFNVLTNSNYMFLMADTPNPSTVTKLIALLGPPPRHIVGLAVVAVISIGVLYVPYAIKDLLNKDRRKYQ